MLWHRLATVFLVSTARLLLRYYRYGTGGAGGDQSFKTGFQKLIVCPRPGVRMETARVKNI